MKAKHMQENSASRFRVVLISMALFISPTYAIESIYYYHNDHLGTPQAMTDDSQTVVWQADYRPFGETTITVATIENNLRFPGQYYDQESGLHYNYFRDYNPTTGQYVQSDPIGLAGGISTYAYVFSNPLRNIDPFGLDVIVTLYQGQGGNPFNHIGIGTTTGSQANQTFGAGPNDGAGIGLFSPVPGHVGPDKGTPIGTITIPTTPQQDAAVNAYNQAAINGGFLYSLTGNSCVDHVRGGLNAAAINIPSTGQDTNLPNTLFESLQNANP